ncbi:hypothetical protein IAR55_007183 [Kwoniella newhampshirensis]|uniref:Uncharacterized protein n=1 Tax=Kwoniella newhampshirensis TaxID=1651941 RepID=A0AAW0YQF1_9TREE
MPHHATNPHRHRRPFDIAVYFITFGLGVATLAAASNALVKRNHDVGYATRVAATRGVKLIVATNKLTQPGFALSTAASGTLLNALFLFCSSFKYPHFARKLVWTVPILSTFYFIFMLATSIAVFYEAKTGHLTSYGTLNGIVLPQSILKANAAAVGLTDDFWGKGYVKFMAIICLPATVFAGITAVLSYGFYKRERSAMRAEQTSVPTYNDDSVAHVEEKGTIEHMERV